MPRSSAFVGSNLVRWRPYTPRQPNPARRLLGAEDEIPFTLHDDNDDLPAIQNDVSMSSDRGSMAQLDSDGATSDPMDDGAVKSTKNVAEHEGVLINEQDDIDELVDIVSFEQDLMTGC